MTDHSTARAPRAYRAILFDLDGTLLPMELEEFLGSYMKDIARFAAEHGIDAKRFGLAFGAGAQAMAMRTPGGETNHHLFWRVFFEYLDRGQANWEELFASYYENEFGRIGEGVMPNPAARRALDELAAKGYPLVLATQPMFPEAAVNWRLAWAGCDGVPFAYKTTYENSAAVKPQTAYYAETLSACGLDAADVLMVGNNTEDDLAIAELGADVYLVTDHLLDPQGRGLDGVRHSTMEEFAAWASGLPACADPAPIAAAAGAARKDA